MFVKYALVKDANAFVAGDGSKRSLVLILCVTVQSQVGK